MVIDNIEEWFRLYSDDVYNFLIYYTRSTDVDDMVQEVFIKAMRNHQSFKGESNPKTWLFTIARHVAIDSFRKKKRDKERQESLDLDVKNEVGPEQIYELSEEKHYVYKAVNSLKDTYRDVVILRGIKEFSVIETAKILGWSQVKVRVTYHRALKMLRDKMQIMEVDFNEMGS